MNPVLQLEEDVPVQLPTHDELRLVVEWSSRWQEFLGSIKPALSRSEARLAGEAPFGLIPLRIMIPSYVLEAILILAAIFVQVKIEELRPRVLPTISSHDVIYYSGDELPRTEDLGGAESGKTGRAGGDEAFHHTQTIKIARGGSLVEKVVDAPNLKLPASQMAVANLLAIRPDPGPPPTEGMRATRSVPNLGASIVAPAPNVIRDYTRNGVQLDTVIAPAPSVMRDKPLTAPSLNTTAIPPAPNVASDHALVAPALAPAVTPPAPRAPRDPFRAAPSLNAAVVPPAPTVSRDQSRSGPALAGNVIPPAPTAVGRDISSSPVQMSDTSVVPPPVSAPERATSHNSKLTLPAPAVVAPPPSTNLAADMRHLAGGNGIDPAKAVVPPPPTASGNGSFMSSLIGKIFGAAEVVPPPPTVNRAASTTASHSLASNVVPPPPSVNAAGAKSVASHALPSNVVPPPPSASAAGGTPSGYRNGMGASLGSNVVAPPPSIGANGGTGNRSHVSAAQSLGAPNVVPPPPSVSGAGGGTGNIAGGAGMASGTLLATNVVPPPPAVGGGANAAGSGLGRKGVGLGAPMNAGAALAQPANGGSGESAGAVISSQPGSKVGLPPSAAPGSLAMSPSGGNKAGVGGAEGGTGIGRGTGTGSGMNGANSGAAKSDSGHGADAAAHGGISPANGPGGAGNITAGNPPVRGVDISGGSSVVTLPSFGSDPSGNDPSTAARSSSVKHSQTLGVTIVATANSGGAFEPYKNLLRGEKYTTYFDTSLGTVVMEFADESTTAHPFGGTLTAPAALRTDLAEGLPKARMVVTCTLDAAGNLKNIRVLEPGPATMTAKVVSALRAWKFQPAMRGEQPVEVTAILGFGIDTNDRF